eukprot:scaffold1700_cov259-Pinguiococcus_pyrenoidosus.AAC.4
MLKREDFADARHFKEEMEKRPDDINYLRVLERCAQDSRHTKVDEALFSMYYNFKESLALVDQEERAAKGRGILKREEFLNVVESANPTKARLAVFEDLTESCYVPPKLLEDKPVSPEGQAQTEEEDRWSPHGLLKGDPLKCEALVRELLCEPCEAAPLAAPAVFAGMPRSSPDVKETCSDCGFGICPFLGGAFASKQDVRPWSRTAEAESKAGGDSAKPAGPTEPVGPVLRQPHTPSFKAVVDPRSPVSIIPMKLALEGSKN